MKLKKNPFCVACGCPTAFFSRMSGKYDPTETMKKSEFLEYVKCKSCGTIQQDPMPTQKKLSQLVATEYSSKKKRLSFEKDTSDNAKAQHMEIVNAIIKYGIKKNILEVGSGVGNLCSYLINNNIDCTGIDISPEVVKLAQKRKLPIKLKNLKDIKSYKSLSAIVMSHVFEHLANPQETLEQINKLLKPKGLFFSAQPTAAMTNFLSRALRFNNIFSKPISGLAYLNMNPWHTVLFSIQGMKQLAKNNGFKLVKVVSMPSIKRKGPAGFVSNLFNVFNSVGEKVYPDKWPFHVAHFFIFRKV